MSDILISLKAYIPKSLGKPLLSYFKNNPDFKPEILSNYKEFKDKLESKDIKEYNWLPEPGNFVTDNYFATDKADFHKLHTDEHTDRLSINLCIDTSKIGTYSNNDISNILKHPIHEDSINSNQHSDDSHSIKAYIKKPNSFDDSIGTKLNSPAGLKFVGVCTPIASKRSLEKKLNPLIKNKLSGTYFTMQGSKVKNDTTVITVSASGGYPFLETLAPSIDFSISVSLYLNNRTVEISIDGEHNDFPAYQLLVDNKSIYNYNPSDYGYTGPTPYNLGYASTKFTSKLQKQLSYLEINESMFKNKKNPFGY